MLNRENMNPEDLSVSVMLHRCCFMFRSRGDMGAKIWPDATSQLITWHCSNASTFTILQCVHMDLTTWWREGLILSFMHVLSTSDWVFLMYKSRLWNIRRGSTRAPGSSSEWWNLLAWLQVFTLFNTSGSILRQARLIWFTRGQWHKDRAVCKNWIA